MKITRASLASKNFLKKFALALTWKDPSRIQISESALKSIRRGQFDFKKPDTLEGMKLLAGFPNKDLSGAIASRKELPSVIIQVLIDNDKGLTDLVSQIFLTPEQFQTLIQKGRDRAAVDDGPDRWYLLQTLLASARADTELLEEFSHTQQLLGAILRHPKVPGDLVTRIGRASSTSDILRKAMAYEALPATAVVELANLFITKFPGEIHSYPYRDAWSQLLENAKGQIQFKLTEREVDKA